MSGNIAGLGGEVTCACRHVWGGKGNACQVMGAQLPEGAWNQSSHLPTKAVSRYNMHDTKSKMFGLKRRNGRCYEENKINNYND